MPATLATAQPSARPSETSIEQRIQAAYRDQPTLRLTLRQAARLWHVDTSTCARLLDRLIAAHVLTRTTDGRFALDRTASRD
jgi:DNA-binding IclR family transcriptional regulator